MDTQIIEKLQEIIRDYKDDQSIVVTADTNIVTDLGLASMDYIAMMVDVEDAFAIRVVDKDFADIRTVGDMVELVKW